MRLLSGGLGGQRDFSKGAQEHKEMEIEQWQFAPCTVGKLTRSGILYLLFGRVLGSWRESDHAENVSNGFQELAV